MDGDLSEVWKALCDAIVGDVTILALLGGAGSVIYSEDKIKKLPAYPAIRLMLTSVLPNLQDSGLGRYEVGLQIDVFGPVKATNWKIQELLIGLLDIPRAKPAGLSTDHFELREMTPGAMTPVGEIGIKDDQNREIHQLALDWSLRIVRTS